MDFSTTAGEDRSIYGHDASEVRSQTAYQER